MRLHCFVAASNVFINAATSIFNNSFSALETPASGSIWGAKRSAIALVSGFF
jgi:hypothetical protein